MGLGKIGRSRIPTSTWVAKVEKFLAEEEDNGEGKGFSIASFKDVDDQGNPLYDNRPASEILEAVTRNETGHYVLLDEEGTITAACAIGMSGARTSPERFSVERVNAQGTAMMGESYERWVNKADLRNDKLEAKLEKAEARIESQQEIIFEQQQQLSNMLVELQKEEGENKLEHILDRGMGMVETHLLQQKVMVILKSLFPRLSESAQAEILLLINTGGIMQAIQSVKALEKAGELEDENNTVEAVQ